MISTRNKAAQPMKKVSQLGSNVTDNNKLQTNNKQLFIRLQPIDFMFQYKDGSKPDPTLSAISLPGCQLQNLPDSVPITSMETPWFRPFRLPVCSGTDASWGHWPRRRSAPSLIGFHPMTAAPLLLSG